MHLTLVTSLVHSLMDYCNDVFVGLPVRDLPRLQTVLSAVVRLVSDLARSCHWLPVQQCVHTVHVQYKLCMLVRPCLYGEALSYDTELEPWSSLRLPSVVSEPV